MIEAESGHAELKGQQAGMLHMRRIDVNEPRPLDRIAKEAGPLVAFRGHCTTPKQTDFEPALTTGLERACLLADGSLTRAPEHEKGIIREFRRRAHHYLPDATLLGDSLELLALMQHHGAPTRLLDWTYSLYVAARH